MAWNDGVDRATGYLVTASNYNDLLGATGSLMELKLHTHDGTNGDGAKLAGETPGRNPWVLGLA